MFTGTDILSIPFRMLRESADDFVYSLFFLLSIPFRMLRLGAMLHLVLPDILFQFLLGCYKVLYSARGRQKDSFQFLLGCYSLSHSDANHVIALSIPFRMLPASM